jgi:hypothetical protein
MRVTGFDGEWSAVKRQSPPKTTSPRNIFLATGSTFFFARTPSRLHVVPIRQPRLVPVLPQPSVSVADSAEFSMPGYGRNKRHFALAEIQTQQNVRKTH